MLMHPIPIISHHYINLLYLFLKYLHNYLHGKIWCMCKAFLDTRSILFIYLFIYIKRIITRSFFMYPINYEDRFQHLSKESANIAFYQWVIFLFMSKNMKSNPTHICCKSSNYNLIIIVYIVSCRFSLNH